MTVNSNQAEQTAKSVRIGELAQASGASTKTIRYYEQIELLPPAQRAENGYRLYSAEDVERLRFIRRARSLGFTLNDLKEVLALRDRGEAPCPYVLQLLVKQATEIEERLRELLALQEDLQALIRRANRLSNNGVELKDCVCHLIYNREK